MPSRPHATPVSSPVDCDALLPGWQFADSFAVPAPPGVDAMAATERAFARKPAWITALMGLRNRLGRVVGLKPAEGPGVPFPILQRSAEEVLLGFDDRHLDFRVAVTVRAGRATLTTVVHWHNAWGRAYLHAILPFHRAIAARMLEGIA
jgi:hypothetical protein